MLDTHLLRKGEQRRRGTFAVVREVPSLLWLILLVVGPYFVTPGTVDAQANCVDIPLAKMAGTENRPAVRGDYIVIEYNATSHQTYWYDYRHGSPAPERLRRNGTFLPVVYSREKIAVRVCNLHFGDVLTVTTSPQGVPEGGADIRGEQPTTATPSLTPVLDVLQAATTTGAPTQIGGLGFSSTGAFPSLQVTGITPGNITLDTTGKVSGYTLTNNGISAEQLARTMFGLQETARNLHDSIKEVWYGQHRGEAPLPGSVAYLKRESEQDSARVREESTWPRGAALSDAALFDQELTATQNLVGELSALSSALGSQNFGSRAVALQTDFNTVRGVLDLVRTGMQRGLSPPLCTIPPPIPGVTTVITKTTKISQGEKVTTTTIKTEGKPAAGYKAPTGTCPDSGATERVVAEKTMFADFYHEYSSELKNLCNAKKEEELKSGARDLLHCEKSDDIFSQLFDDLYQLRGDLESIDKNTGELFQSMNEWNAHSHVEQTDLVQPVAGNALVRISIVVQHNYVPFTLSGPPASISPGTPAVNAPPAAAPPQATTSTPTHSVKTILVEVHRWTNFNVAGGAVLIHVPTYTYAAVLAPDAPSPVLNPPQGSTETQQGTCNKKTSPIAGSNTNNMFNNYYCIVTSQKSDWQVAAMAGMVWYPWGRDYFPRGGGLSFQRHNLIPGMLMGTSVTSLGNAVGAVNFEPVTGIDFYGGVGSGHTQSLADGLTPDTPIGGTSSTAPTLPVTTTLHGKLALGVALDLNVFTSIFSKAAGAQAASMP